MFILLINISFGITVKSNIGDFKVTYPDVVNPLEPIILHFEVEDKNIIENASFIKGQFSIPLSEGDGFKHKSNLTLGEFNKYQYNGQKKFNIAISLYSNGALDLYNKEDYSDKTKKDLETTREISFYNDKYKAFGRIKLKFKATPYRFNDIPVPEGFVKKVNLNKLIANYYNPNSKSSNHIDVLFNTLSKEHSGKFKQLSLNEIKKLWSKPSEEYNEENIKINNLPSKFYYQCHIGGFNKKYHSECHFIGHKLTNIGIITIYSDFDADNTTKEKAKRNIEDWKKLAGEEFKDAQFIGKKPKKIDTPKTDDLTCYSNDDCSENEVCNLCGKCITKDKIYDEKDVTLKDVSLNTKFTSKEILNKIDSLIIVRIKPIFDIINKKGDKVNVCNLKQGSFDNLIIHGRIKENNSYSGFTSGMLYDKRDRIRDRHVDLTKKDSQIAFFISPNDREKYVGQTKDITEHVIFTFLNGNKNLTEKEYKYVLKPYDSSIKVKTSSKQMQQDSAKVIAFTVNNKYAKELFVKVKLFGIGGIKKGDASLKHTINDSKIITQKSFFISLKPNKEYRFIYYSPKLGNADIGQALSSLSMTNLQKEGAESTAIDAITLGVGHGLKKGAKAIKAMETTSDATLKVSRKYFKIYRGTYSTDKVAKMVHDVNFIKKYGENFNKVKKLVDTEDKINGLSQVYGSGSSVYKSIASSINNNEKTKKSWREIISRAGVAGINGLQGAVGGVMLVADKVPGFGPLAQGLFSFTTNIWKANFQYIADSERIDRIQELFWPNIIMIEATDESGWTTRSLMVIKVAYHQI